MTINVGISGCSDFPLGQNVQEKKSNNSCLFLPKNEGHNLLASSVIRREKSLYGNIRWSQTTFDNFCMHSTKHTYFQTIL